jgi:hypothetical protein
MIRSLFVLAISVMAAAATPLGAQGRERESRSEVPRAYLPPPGMCRIWLDNVPPAQQPAPTDCASAVRNRPENGRVIFNDAKRGSLKLPPVKSLRPGGREAKPENSTGRGERKPLLPPSKERRPDANP